MYDEKLVWLFCIIFAEWHKVTHRGTSISHVIYFEFAFTPVCIVSNRSLFVRKENLSCMSELQFSHNHNYVTNILKNDYRAFQNLLDSGLEYCYGLLKSSKLMAKWLEILEIVRIVISVNFDRTVRQLRKQYKRQAYKQKYKSVESVKYGQLNKTDKKWVQKKPLMVSCIITLKIFVFCSGKLSPITQPLKGFL